MENYEMKEEAAMNCPACGREMSCWGLYAVCPNILCDYMEDVVTGEVGTERPAQEYNSAVEQVPVSA